MPFWGLVHSLVALDENHCSDLSVNGCSVDMPAFVNITCELFYVQAVLRHSKPHLAFSSSQFSLFICSCIFWVQSLQSQSIIIYYHLLNLKTTSNGDCSEFMLKMTNSEPSFFVFILLASTYLLLSDVSDFCIVVAKIQCIYIAIFCESDFIIK